MRRLRKIHIQNFETIEDAWLEFDQRGVLVLKGYNDSGKSAIVMALRVLLYDYRRREHTAFVRDDTEFARIVWYDEDGIIVLRDIFSNGQTYYRVFKDNFENEIFTTLSNGVIVPFEGVPEFVQKIFGVGSYDKLYLNTGDDRDPILLAETSGGDNYKFLSTQLHSDELALASNLLNSDKNAKQTKISELSAELAVLRKEYNSLYGVSEALVNRVSNMDERIDILDTRESMLKEISEKGNSIQGLGILPTLLKIESDKLKVINDIMKKSKELDSETLPVIPIVEQEQLGMMQSIIKGINSINENILPKLNSIDGKKLDILRSILSNIQKVQEAVVIPELSIIDKNRVVKLLNILRHIEDVRGMEMELTDNQRDLEKYKNELSLLESEVSKYKVHTVKCTNCGTVMTTVEE